MTLQAAFYRMAENEGISVVEMETPEGTPNHHCIRILGEYGVYEGHALFLEEDQLFLFYIIWGALVPEDACEKMAWELMKRNYGLKIGQWFIDPESRVLTLRVSQYLSPNDDLPERMRRIVESCGQLADKDFREIAAEIA